MTKFLWKCSLECDPTKYREGVLKLVRMKGEVLMKMVYSQEGTPEWGVEKDSAWECWEHYC